MNYLIGENKSLRSSIIEKKTWSEVKTLRDNSKLGVGLWYRITDYNCVVNSTITTIKSGNHNYDILVLAIDTNRLSEKALATKHDGDTYFQYCNLEAWELKYCLDNDQTRFPWCGSDTDNGKGAVWWLKDEYENEAFYDFKNIMATRYRVTAQQSITPFDLVTQVPFAFISENTELTLDTNNPIYFYTFTSPIIVTEATQVTQNLIYDFSVSYQAKAKTKNFKFGNNKLLDRSHIGPFEESSSVYLYINCFIPIFISNTSTNIFFNISNNTLKNGCYNNTFNCTYIDNQENVVACNNNFESDCYANTFGGNYYNNNLGHSCNTNIFGINFYNNSLGQENTKIRASKSFNTNTIGNYNTNFIITNSFDTNIIGNDNSDFTINADFVQNNIGNSNQDLSVGSPFRNNFLGNGNKHLALQGGTQHNNFGNFSSYITIPDSILLYYSSLGNYIRYLTFTLGTSGNLIKGCVFGNNIGGTSSSYRRYTTPLTNQQYWN